MRRLGLDGRLGGFGLLAEMEGEPAGRGGAQRAVLSAPHLGESEDMGVCWMCVGSRSRTCGLIPGLSAPTKIKC